MTRDLDALPFLKPALLRHLEEYPWRRDGLTRTERRILELVAEGVDAPGPLFAGVMDSETVLFGGDWWTFGVVARLCRGEEPLLTCTPGPEFVHPPNRTLSREAFSRQRLSLSAAGKRRLGGDRRTLARDMWLGGVHVTGRDWAWDDDDRALVRLGA